MPMQISDDQMRQALDAAMTDLAAAVDVIRPDQWSHPSPCAGWTVYDVVDHVVMGDHFCVRVIGGASLADAIEDLPRLAVDEPDAGAVVRNAAAGARAAFAQPLDRTVDHPVGVIPARRFLSFRVLDQLGHAWDLQAALGVETISLSAHALDVALAVAEVERQTLEESTNFATTPGAGADIDDPLERFLAVMGRSSTWQPEQH